jgi:ABC-type transport system substrate-binding protein
LSSADKPSDLVPGLAVSWSVDEADKTKWTFRLREGVTFHDGSAFSAESVVWNLDKLLNDKSPQYDPRQSAQGRSRIPGVASYRAVDPGTLEITTKGVDATLAYQLAWIMISSPAQWEKVGRSWDAFAKTPAGTGPWKLAAFVPRERAEMVPNPDYWDKARVPKLDRLVLIPLPEANARVAALRSGQVDWIEAPAPDAVASLKQAGFKIITNAYPHNWTWHLSRAEGSPWNDIRVRKAANLAIDRDAIVKLLGGLVTPAYGEVDKSSAWFGKPTFEIKYAPDEARRLMTDAGYSKTKPLQARISIQASGTNQTVNEAIQEMLKEAFFNIEFKAVELETLMTGWRGGARADMNKDVSATNVTHVTSDPFYAVNRFFASDQTAPIGVNWSFYKNPEVDQLVVELKSTFDPAKQDEIAARIHAKAVDDAVMIWVYHDTTPRALSAKIKKYVQAQSWFQDLALVEI